MNKRKFTLQCPMPELDFEIVTLGHGSGGKLTNDLLDKGVFSLFENDALQQRHDGAFLDISGKLAFTTDSFVVNPIFFPGFNNFARQGLQSQILNSIIDALSH